MGSTRAARRAGSERYGGQQQANTGKGEWVPRTDADLRPAELPERFCICVSRDDFGLLATNRKLLLEKTLEERWD